jgi:hypothetical protein
MQCAFKPERGTVCCCYTEIPAELLNLLGYVAVSNDIFDFRKSVHHHMIQIN